MPHQQSAYTIPTVTMARWLAMVPMLFGFRVLTHRLNRLHHFVYRRVRLCHRKHSEPALLDTMMAAALSTPIAPLILRGFH